MKHPVDETNNIFLQYSCMRDKIPKVIAAETKLHLNTVYSILRKGWSANYKTRIRLKKYLSIPDKIFQKEAVRWRTK